MYGDLFTTGYFCDILLVTVIKVVTILGIGSNIKDAAQKQGISLKELSRRADIPYTTIYNMVKRNSNRVSPQNIQKIADALGVGVGELYGLKLLDKTTNSNLKNLIPYIGQLNSQDHTAQKQRAELEAAFSKLNHAGKEEAIKRVQELTRLTEYSDNEVSDTIQKMKQVSLLEAESAGLLSGNKIQLSDDLQITEDELNFLIEQLILDGLPQELVDQYLEDIKTKSAGDVPDDTSSKEK